MLKYFFRQKDAFIFDLKMKAKFNSVGTVKRMGILPMTTWTSTFLLWQFRFTCGHDTAISIFSLFVFASISAFVELIRIHFFQWSAVFIHVLTFFLFFFKAFQSKSFQIESPWLVPRGLWVSNEWCAQPPSYCLGVFMPTKPHREQWLLTPRHSCPSMEIGSYHKS